MSWSSGLYTKKFTTKIIRTQHEVRFALGTHADVLKAALLRVPDNARITDFDELEDGKVITFEEETEERAQPAEEK